MIKPIELRFEQTPTSTCVKADAARGHVETPCGSHYAATSLCREGRRGASPLHHVVRAQIHDNVTDAENGASSVTTCQQHTTACVYAEPGLRVHMQDCIGGVHNAAHTRIDNPARRKHDRVYDRECPATTCYYPVNGSTMQRRDKRSLHDKANRVKRVSSQHPQAIVLKAVAALHSSRCDSLREIDDMFRHGHPTCPRHALHADS